ncbi:hypothetical protein [Candidatus Methylacidiphilum infernorum]|uniref:Uncharacterized protein n=1 Tax=Methylacidiphilum infernorum (isolate V4) TaxID=481448 RepID=B3DY78_METI4|nr:hypothetical protein [Candidatus Methylacidiphilum infernorum]ACD82355.1 Conserved hypothetical protein [Methylacidiphilum infernorum V4]
MGNQLRFLLLCFLSLPFWGCIYSHYLPEEGYVYGLKLGKGQKKTVDGVDVWMGSRPDRPYRVYGTLYDKRGNGPFEKGPTLKGLVKKAKQRGADGLIILVKERQYVGDTLYATKVGSGTTESFYSALLVRYLPE